MRLALQLCGLTLGGLLVACSSSVASTTTITRPELVAVDPADFMGLQECAVEMAADGGDDAGAAGADTGKVKSYVATLFDVTTQSDGGPTPEQGFPLPSSPPTSCLFPVTFSFVTPGHRYRAEIDAYDRFPKSDMNELDSTHIKAVSTGGRLQENSAGHVAPRWKAACSGYPPTLDLDGGADAGDDAGISATDAGQPGVISYNTLTSTVHYCPGGLQPVP